MNYTIKDISNLLNVSEEQIRRWCRSGQLKSLKHSRKKGYVIEKCDFFAFLNDNPRRSNGLMIRLAIIGDKISEEWTGKGSECYNERWVGNIVIFLFYF